MKPDFQKAAIKAMETLVTYNICTTPIIPLPVLKKYPGVLVLSFEEMANRAGTKRKELVPLFGANQDAATFLVNLEKIKYVVVYNQYLPFEMIWRGLARELGHIVLGHDGATRPMEIRRAESMCFAQHLLCPRPLISAIRSAGIPLTLEVLGNITGCYEQCLEGMRHTPGVHVPAELNRKVKEQFSPCLTNFLQFQPYLSRSDTSAPADFGQFMDGYVE